MKRGNAKRLLRINAYPTNSPNIRSATLERRVGLDDDRSMRTISTFDYFRGVDLSLLSAWPDYQLAQRGRYIVIEKKTYPSGRPKFDLISIREADGRDLFVSDGSGFYSSHLPVPEVVFSYFVEQGLVYHDARESDADRSIFRLTPEALGIAAQLGYRERPIPHGIAQLLNDIMEESKRWRSAREDAANHAFALGVGSLKDVIEAKRHARQRQ